MPHALAAVPFLPPWTVFLITMKQNKPSHHGVAFAGCYISERSNTPHNLLIFSLYPGPSFLYRLCLVLFRFVSFTAVLQHLRLYLAHSRCSPNICLMSDWMNGKAQELLSRRYMTQLPKIPAPIIHHRMKPRMNQEKDEISSDETQAEQLVPTSSSRNRPKFISEASCLVIPITFHF